MTTVIFVHGTGIREPEYQETFKIIEEKIHAQRPEIRVAPCLWGVEFGAKFNDRASVPLEDATLALSQKEEDADIVLWGQLYRDPLYELRLGQMPKPGRRLFRGYPNGLPHPNPHATCFKSGIARDRAVAPLVKATVYTQV